MKYFGLIFLLIVGCKSSIQYPNGGYDYPKNVDVKDSSFYCYQLKDSLTTSDSFNIAYYGKYILSSFNEPNLSIQPIGNVVFRFVYDSDKQTIISLNEDKIIIKEVKQGSTYPIDNDTSKLNDLEKFHFQILKWNFPLNETRLKLKSSSKYFDSLTKVYPELMNPNHYQALLKKSEVFDNNKFEYSTKIIPITHKTFAYFVNLINSSGFWNMPYEVNCDNVPTHSSVFVLEANTAMKYKIINVTSCPSDATDLNNACQELINYAGLKDKIQLIW